jgi:hypothetical protein
MGEVAGSATAPVDGGGDPNKLDIGPAQEHGHGAHVVGVSTEVGVQMNPHHQSFEYLARNINGYRCHSTTGVPYRTS